MGISTTVAQRGSRYGTFEQNSYVTQQLCSAIYRAAAQAGRKYNFAELEGIHMICHKIARIVCGHGKVKDNWHDIGGYAIITKPLASQIVHTGYPDPNEVCHMMYLLLQAYRPLEEYEKTALYGIITMLAMSTVMSDEVIWDGIISYAEVAELLTNDE